MAFAATTGVIGHDSSRAKDPADGIIIIIIIIIINYSNHANESSLTQQNWPYLSNTFHRARLMST